MRKDGNQCFPMGLIHNTIILPKQKKIYTICVDVRNIVICAGDFKKIIMSEGIFETIRVDFGGSAPQNRLCVSSLQRLKIIVEGYGYPVAQFISYRDVPFLRGIG